MRIFCPEHGKGFFAPRQNPIRCENRGHTMGDLDFEGDAHTPIEARWEYCCNCAHFFLLISSADGIERCPACARQLFTRYVCDRCYVITCESNTPAQNKNFALTKEGLPQPTCPGCLQLPATEVREHDCDELGAVFVTALTACPLCRERLDVSPTFPASVTYYLKRTRKKVNVTFDYDTECFCPAEDGEFVVVQNGSDVEHELMLPRMPSFSSKRDFYDHYQDSFYCSDPTNGEVEVIEPALVDRVENSWRLNKQGILKVIQNPPIRKRKPLGLTKKKPTDRALRPEPIRTEVSPKPIQTTISAKPIEPEVPAEPTQVVSPKPARVEVPREPATAEVFSRPVKTAPPPKQIEAEIWPKPIKSDVSSMMKCAHCNSVLESKYAFCWHCGRPTESNLALASRPSRKTTRLEPGLIEDDEITISHEPLDIAGATSIFPWAQEEPAPPITYNSSALKLVALVLLGLILVAVMMFIFGRRSSSNVPSEGSVSEKPANELHSVVGSQSSGPVTQFPKTAPAADARSADAEFQTIKSRSNGVGDSDRERILRELKAAEKDYPKDYRFPYEQAKLSISPQETHSHHEAFDAIMRAAQKAIEYGKADEMLASLTSDKDGDFYKLSRGHSEWQVVERALRDKDESQLRH
jgi:hypothetical protein